MHCEAFSEQELKNLVVINADPNVAGIVRELTHFSGAVVTCNDLRSLYGLPETGFAFTESEHPPTSQ